MGLAASAGAAGHVKMTYKPSELMGAGSAAYRQQAALRALRLRLLPVIAYKRVFSFTTLLFFVKTDALTADISATPADLRPIVDTIRHMLTSAMSTQSRDVRHTHFFAVPHPLSLPMFIAASACKKVQFISKQLGEMFNRFNIGDCPAGARERLIALTDGTRRACVPLPRLCCNRVSRVVCSVEARYAPGGPCRARGADTRVMARDGRTMDVSGRLGLPAAQT